MRFIQECERTMIIVEKKKEPQIDATEFSNLVASIKHVLANGDKCIIEKTDYEKFTTFDNVKYFLKMHFRIGLKNWQISFFGITVFHSYHSFYLQVQSL